ncbi:hypothetical protein BJF78_16975 [Pseudonocardia sp. CNS-139]|nr:hypothetical protein BJF78_16975 [Pseudonocardia sp. CNS-139]
MPSLRALTVPLGLPLAAAVLAAVSGCGISRLAEPSPGVPPPAPVPAVTVRCTETTPTAPADRPEVLALTSSPWFGVSDLWAGLPDQPAVAQDGALVLRFPWVTLADDEPTGELGPPTVVATRTDAPGEASAQVGAYAQAFGISGLAFWPAAVTFPAPGCWTVTGTFGSTAVAFAVRVDEP